MIENVIFFVVGLIIGIITNIIPDLFRGELREWGDRRIAYVNKRRTHARARHNWRKLSQINRIQQWRFDVEAYQKDVRRMVALALVPSEALEDLGVEIPELKDHPKSRRGMTLGRGSGLLRSSSDSPRYIDGPVRIAVDIKTATKFRKVCPQYVYWGDERVLLPAFVDDIGNPIGQLRKANSDDS